MTGAGLPWASRHDSILAATKDTALARAIKDLEVCRNSIQPEGSGHAKDVADETSRLSRQSELALCILWSSLSIPIGRDPNPFRSSALPAVRRIASASLKIDDFKSIKTLQRSSGSFVEVVRCKIDRKLYVLKTIVKGFAKRNSAIQSPIYEAKLLRSTDVDTPSSAQRELTPSLFAAFHTQGSVHILMEYVQSGDFSEMLMAASKCGPEYPGRASTGLLVEDWIQRYAVDMVLAMGWVHAQGYAHRDIKPGNFLLSQSGHLKLCDFSSAAPFSRFHVAEPALEGRSVWARKVHKFYCSLPVGTCDYLSPELLEAEEERISLKQQQQQQQQLDPEASSFAMQDFPWSKPPATSTNPDEKSPGPYGPELDWWSLGIMLYEMRYGVLPFFADQMQATYELIKDHEKALRFDPSIECSDPLRSLIRQLLTTSVRRLGRLDTEEIHEHDFFSGVDWSQPWPLDPPFVPKAAGDTADVASDNHEPELSTIYSPQVRHPLDHAHSLSEMDTVPNLSSLYSGNLDEFPAFVDSRDFDDYAGSASFSNDQASGSGLQHESGILQGSFEASRFAAGNDSMQLHPSVSVSLMPRSSSSPAVFDNFSSPAPYRQLAIDSSPSPMAGAKRPRWSDCDLSFIGFTYLPGPEAFRSVEPERQPEHPEPVLETLSAAPSMQDLSMHSPGAWLESSGPLASTPCHRQPVDVAGFTGMPTPPVFSSTPAFAAHPAKSLQKKALEAATRSGAPVGPNSFVTPARKPSWFGIPDSIRSNDPASTAQTPANVLPASDPGMMAAVLQSPYPFPMASLPPTSRKESVKMPLRRNDLARARSATPGAGSVGSDSRHSGGSNAMRDLSEREAWDEMMVAVQKSVRKKQREAPTPAKAKLQAPRSGIPHSLTDPALSSSANPRRTLNTPEIKQMRQRANVALPTLATIAPSPEAGTSSSRQDHGVGATTQAERVVRREASRSSLRAPKPITPASDNYDSDASSDEGDQELAVPSRLRPGRISPQEHSSPAAATLSAGTGTTARAIRHKRSARQLLIKAQERTTPTKPARVQSPSLPEAFSAKLESARSSSPLTGSDQPLLSSSPHEYAKENTPTPPISLIPLSGQNGSSDGLALGKGQVPILGAFPLLDVNGRREASSETNALPVGRNGGLRRKDSREMLSEYRQGLGRASSMMAISSATLSLSPPDDAFLDTDAQAPTLALGQSDALKSRRRFSSALPGKHGGGDELKTRGFGRFRQRVESETLEEDPNESPEAVRRQNRSHESGEDVKVQGTSADRTAGSSLSADGDVSLMTGLGQRHSALQGSLFGLERRLAKIKARLED